MRLVLAWLGRGLLAVLLVVVLSAIGFLSANKVVHGFWVACDEWPIRAIARVEEVVEAGRVTYLVEEGRFVQSSEYPLRFNRDWVDCSERRLAQMDGLGIAVPGDSVLPVSLYKEVFERWSPTLLETAQSSLLLEHMRRSGSTLGNVYGVVYRVRTTSEEEVFAWDLWCVVSNDAKLHEQGFVGPDGLVESTTYKTTDTLVQLYGALGGFAVGCLVNLGLLVRAFLRLWRRRHKET